MSPMRNFSSFLSQSKRMAANTIGACALLAMTGPALSAEAGAKDEVLKLTTAIQIPGIPALISYDISYADPGLKKYVLAVRNAKAIAIVDATNNYRAMPMGRQDGENLCEHSRKQRLGQ